MIHHMRIEVDLETPERGAQIVLVRIDERGEVQIWGRVDEDMLLNHAALAEHMSQLFGRFDPETGTFIRRAPISPPPGPLICIEEFSSSDHSERNVGVDLRWGKGR